MINNSGSIVISNSDKADVLNAYNASVGITDNGHIPTCPSLTFKETIETVDFHESGVMAEINKLKPNLSSGPDNIPLDFIRS